MPRNLAGLTLNNKFRIQEAIGEGGMSIVYLAQDLRLPRRVAIKSLHPNRRWTTEAIDALKTEASIIANLVHPHILTVHDLDVSAEDSELVFLVMEFAEGGTLAKKIDQGKKLPEGQVAKILRETCEALDHAHRERVVHLDLKPQNILFDAFGNVRVADFGLAKLLERGNPVKADTGHGTPEYMAPEQVEGGDVGPYTDIYALGITLHEMLTGRVPKRVRNSRLPVQIAKSDLKARIADVIERSLHRDPRARYRTAGEFVDAFETALSNKQTTNRQTSTRTPQPILLFGQQYLVPQSHPRIEAPTFTKKQAEDLAKSLRALGSHAQSIPSLNEREIVTYAFSCGLFTSLGYSPGQDALLEHRQTDVILRAFNGRTLAIIEFKRPSRSPSEGIKQIENQYVPDLQPDVAVLCNGREMWIYRCAGAVIFHPPVLQIQLWEATEKDAEEVYNWLARRAIDLTDLSRFESVLQELTKTPKPVIAPNEPGGRAFLSRFALRPETPFGRLVGAMQHALPSLLSASTFAKGAYSFWRRVYAREAPKKSSNGIWNQFLHETDQSDESVYQLMFVIESAYAILSRLLLARAMENHKFPGLNLVKVAVAALDRKKGPGRLELHSYAFSVQDILEKAGNNAFESLFASDIFDWWFDIASAANGDEVGERLAEALLAIFEFDFSAMTGDLFGELYQSYFDAETRKALGEFYTPPEVVDFILDRVGYTERNDAIRKSRLLDPACGSGTFLVHALQRYLKATQGMSRTEVLNDLLASVRIVGFDVHPFAVLMAQANYAAQIIPLYAKARDEGGIVPAALSIPVLRTDSLRQEYREGELPDLGVGEVAQLRLVTITLSDDVTVIQTELPVQVQDHFIPVSIPVPRFDTARKNGWVQTPEEYFAALSALFSTVRAKTSDLEVLRKNLKRAGLPKWRELADYMFLAAKMLVETMEKLRIEYGDGRFLKTMADLALALILKSDMNYHYIVGNPPYISIDEIPEIYRKWWKEWYLWATHKFDAYIPFIERSVAGSPRDAENVSRQWLRLDGRLGLICSDRFLLAKYAEGLRDDFPNHAAVELLIDFRVSTVFEGASNSPAILIARRIKQASPLISFPVVRFTANVSEKDVRQALPAISESLKLNSSGVEYIQQQQFDTFTESSVFLRKDAWLLMPAKERSVFNRIELAAQSQNTNRKSTQHNGKVIRLEDLTKTGSGLFQGIATGDDSSLILKLIQDRGETLVLAPRGSSQPDWKGPREIEVEREVVRPWLFGHNVERWHVNWSGWYVFYPYAPIAAMEKRGKAWMKVTRERLIPTSDTSELFRNRYHYVDSFPLLDKNFRRAWKEYLKLPAIESRLRARENGRRQKNQPESFRWYDLGRPQNLEWFSQTKILSQVASKEPDFALDNGAQYILQHGGRGGGTDGIVLNESVDPWLILGLLNSSVLDFYLKHISPVFNKSGSYSYSDAFLKQLPIRLPSENGDQLYADNIAALANNLSDLKKKLRETEEERGRYPMSRLTSSPTSSSSPLRDYIKGSPKSQVLRRSDIRYVSNLFGETEIRFGNSVLSCSDRSLIEIIKIWLRTQSRDTLEVNELLSIRVPDDVEDRAPLVAQGEEFDKIIFLVSTQIKEKEKELNMLVADYYGLQKEDRDIIEDFLSRF